MRVLLLSILALLALTEANVVKGKANINEKGIKRFVDKSTDLFVTAENSVDWRGPAAIIGGALAHLTLGTLYCWGNFLSYSPLR